MALIDPAPIDIRIKELHGKKILITMCLFWLEARFAFCDQLVLANIASGELIIAVQLAKGKLLSFG